MTICLTGNETLAIDKKPAISEFWRWAFSDLKQNNVRGVFSEWLVAQILELDLTQARESWDAYDLITPTGITLEVKSAAYLQSWTAEYGQLSKIVFQGLKGKTWTPKAGYSESATYNADFYVFCLQICKDPAQWNALDLEQWEFYVLPKVTMESLNLKTIGLSTLSRLTPSLNAIGFRQFFLDVMEIRIETTATTLLFN